MNPDQWLKQLLEWHRGVPEEGSPRYDQPLKRPRGMLPFPWSGGMSMQYPMVTPQPEPRWLPENEVPMKRFDPNANRRAYQQQLIERWLQNMPAEDALRLLRELETDRTPYDYVRG